MAATGQSDGSINHRALLVNARRVVIKVGTGVVCNAENEFDPLQVSGLAASVAGLVKAGRQVVLVSSGAVTLGAAELGLHRSRLKDASITRACAAVGQCKLMEAYAESFRPHGLKVAQVLVTEDDFSDLKRHSILRQTFERLLKLGAVPIVNENDTVTNIYTEQAPVFRDNDRLAALVLSKLDADALVLLSNVDGLLYSAHQELAHATVVSMVTEITAAIRESARGTSSTGRGGMAAKLDAAEIAMQAGGLVVIANGKTPGVLERIFQGEEVGTLFLPGSAHGRKTPLACLCHHSPRPGHHQCQGGNGAFATPGQPFGLRRNRLRGRIFCRTGDCRGRSGRAYHWERYCGAWKPAAFHCACFGRKPAWRAGAPREFSDLVGQRN